MSNATLVLDYIFYCCCVAFCEGLGSMWHNKYPYLLNILSSSTRAVKGCSHLGKDAGQPKETLTVPSSSEDGSVKRYCYTTFLLRWLYAVVEHLPTCTHILYQVKVSVPQWSNTPLLHWKKKRHIFKLTIHRIFHEWQHLHSEILLFPSIG